MHLQLKELINSKQGKYIFSIILGLGLASIFRKACTSRNCLVFKAPSINNIEEKIFGHNDKCYKFNTNSTSCSLENTDKLVLDL